MGRKGHLVLGVLSFVAYAWTASPDIFWRDSGELTACAVSLGVCHPTGFPLSRALAKLVSLVPLGSLGFRVALASALAGALLVGLVYRLTEEILVPLAVAPALQRLGAFGAAAALAVTGLAWRDATVAEVYASTAAMLALGLLLLWRMLRTPDPRHGLAGALFCGLASVGLHATLRWELVLPWAVLWLWYLLRTRARWPKAAPILFVLGLAPALGLVVRSTAGAAADWGHPRTLAALWDHLTALRIRRAFAARMLTTNLAWLRHDILAMVSVAWDQVLGVWPVLSLVGLWAVLRPRVPQRRTVRTFGLILLWVALTDFVYSFWVNPMGIRDLQNGLHFLVATAVLGGYGLVRAAGFLAQSLHALAVTTAAVLALVTVVPPAVSNWGANTSATDWGPSAWSHAALSQAPPGAVLFVESDDLAAGLTYLQVAKEARPDVLVVVRQHVWDLESLRRAAQRAAIDLPADELATYGRLPLAARLRRRIPFLAALLQAWARSGRAILWEPGDGTDLPALQGLRIREALVAASGREGAPGDEEQEDKGARPAPSSRGPAGRVVSRLVPATLLADAPLFVFGPPDPTAVVGVVQRTFEILQRQGGPSTRQVGARHLTAVARWAYGHGLRAKDSKERLAWADAAIMACHSALKFRLNHSPALVNLGAALALRAQVLVGREKERAVLLMGRALSAVLQGLALRPVSRAALLNAARFSVTLYQWTGDRRHLGRARSWLARARTLGYRDAEVAFNLGLVEANLGHYRRAARWFAEAVEKNPTDTAARLYLDRVRKLAEEQPEVKSGGRSSGGRPAPVRAGGSRRAGPR